MSPLLPFAHHTNPDLCMLRSMGCGIGKRNEFLLVVYGLAYCPRMPHDTGREINRSDAKLGDVKKYLQVIRDTGDMRSG